MDLHELDVRINAAGESASAMSQAIVDAVKSGADLEVFRPFVKPLAEHGLLLASIQAWSNAAKSAVKEAPALPAGQVVADVGGGEYTGPLDPDTLTKENWAAWATYNKLHAHTGQIFSKAPVIGIASTGYLYTPGDLANAVPDGRPFGPFLSVWAPDV
jgi:hypothetical protein